MGKKKEETVEPKRPGRYDLSALSEPPVNYAYLEKQRKIAKKKMIQCVLKTLLSNWVKELICLLIGLSVGVILFFVLTWNDCFEIVGEQIVVLSEGTQTYIYEDEGCRLVSYGFDRSDDVTVRTNMKANDDGTYVCDFSKYQEFYVIYSIESSRYRHIYRVRVIKTEEN